MRKLAIATTAVALMLGLGAGTASAHDNNRGWQSRFPHPVQRGVEMGRRAPTSQVVRVDLHRRVFDETIPLRRLLGLDRDYRGYDVRSVNVRLRPDRGRASLDLLADGRVVDRSRRRDGGNIELRTGHENTLGRDLSRLQLAVRGRTYIESISVELRAPRRGDHGRVIHRTEYHPRGGDAAAQIVRIILGQMQIADGRH